MSAVVRTERTEHYVDWSVPLPIDVTQVIKATHAAIDDARAIGIDVSYDDCVMVHSEDDERLVFSIRVKP